jgi:GT2 family glycosyltransferase
MAGLIGIPYHISTLMEFTLSLCTLNTHGSKIGTLRASALHLARESFAERCMRENAEYLCFIDTDMEFPSNLIDQLLSHNLPIVSAMCFKKNAPFAPAFFSKLWFDEKKIMKAQIYDFNEVPKQLFEVEGVGMAAIIIRREVFENTPRPWFAPYPYAGEDVSFCMRARNAGYKIYIDPSMIIEHCGIQAADAYSYLEHKKKIEEFVGGSV